MTNETFYQKLEDQLEQSSRLKQESGLPNWLQLPARWYGLRFWYINLPVSAVIALLIFTLAQPTLIQFVKAILFIN